MSYSLLRNPTANG